MLDRIKTLLGTCGTDEAVLPPTALYNEGWMLRLVLDWFSKHPGIDHPLSFLDGARWYSEALLPSQFKPRDRRDDLGESYTHADGVIAQFFMGREGHGDLNLTDEATQFIVVESKMFSRLSSGVTHAKYYNQAARNVACMAEVLKLEGREVSSFEKLGFYVLAPEIHLNEESTFDTFMSREDIKKIVLKRVEEYGIRDDGKEKREWHEKHFIPLMEKVEIAPIPWEELAGFIGREDAEYGSGLLGFYSKCLEFNKKPPKKS